MTSLNEFHKNINYNRARLLKTACSAQIKDICQPFMLMLGIKNISYFRISNCGETILLNTSEECVKYFFGSKMDFSCMSKLIPQTIVYEDDVPDLAQYREIMAKKFGFYHGISYVVSGKNSIEIFSFHVDESRENFKYDFQLSLIQLEIFIRNFKLKTVKARKELNKFPLLIGKSADYFKSAKELLTKSKNDLMNKSFINKKEKSYGRLKKKIYLDAPFEHITITRLQVLMLQRLCYNMTYKEIGEQLYLSWLSIRDNVDILREKFLCKSKKELVNLIKESHVLDNIIPVDFTLLDGGL